MAEGYVGEIRIFAGWSFRSPAMAPINWMLCQGQTLSISQYQALFTVIGTTYGGNGSTNFMIPDLRGRGAMHYSTTAVAPVITPKPLGQAAGTEMVTLTDAQVGQHSHTLYASLTTATTEIPNSVSMLSQIAPQNTFYANGTQSGGLASLNLNSDAIGSSGGNQSHNNMMTSFVLNYMICTNGLFPVQQ